MSRPDQPTDAPSRDAVARIFARLTADRDDLRTAIELCERRLAVLERALDDPSAPSADHSASEESAAAKALRLAEEALATAQYALEQTRGRH